jgi:hypothetical protein
MTDAAIRSLAEWLLVFAPIGILAMILPVLLLLRFNKKGRTTKIAFSILCLCIGAWFLAMTVSGLHEGRLVSRPLGRVVQSDGARYWISATIQILGACFFVGLGLWAMVKSWMPSNSTPHTDARASSVLNQSPSARAGERGR